MTEHTYRVGVFDGEKFQPVFVKAGNETEARSLAQNPTLSGGQPHRKPDLADRLSVTFGAKVGLASVAVRVR